MAENTKTIGEEALEKANSKEAPKTETKTEEVKAETKKAEPKFKGGLYRSDKFLRIIKRISYEHQKDDAGKIQKTYGTWAKADNFIIFSKGVEKRLTDEEVALPAVQRLIESKAIFRVGD